jgi:two-component system sensor histidine kinase KdpD
VALSAAPPPNSESDFNAADCLLSAAAHELRLPLSHIKGFVSTLRRPGVQLDDLTRQDFLAQIEGETDRLTQLIDDLVDHSSVGHGRTRQAQHKTIRPIALIAGGLDRVRALLPGRRIEADVPIDLPKVEVDAAAIERVIANLLDNALKYAPADSPIRISAAVVDAHLELHVEDDGPGISPGERARIFNRFYRGPAARRSGRPGNGLGLAICRSIVSTHGGRIWTETPPRGGTRFAIALPLTAASAPRRADSSNWRSSGRRYRESAAGMRREPRGCWGSAEVPDRDLLGKA